MKPKRKGKASQKKRRRLEREAEIGITGTVAGAVAGAGAGPPGAVVGAILGGVAGAMAGVALDKQDEADLVRTRRLDASIGVTKGELGAANLRHLPAVIGAFSTASAGVAADEPTPAEGPIEVPKG